MGKRLILVGGGHAHMMTMAHIRQLVRCGHQVTVIGPSEHHYYSGMGPGLLGQYYAPEQIRFATRRAVEKQGGTFVLAKVARIDPEKQLVVTDSGHAYPYDVVSLNSGSFVPCKMVENAGPAIFAVKPIEGLIKARKTMIGLSLGRHAKVAVVGGGPAAVEMAGNAHQLLIRNRSQSFQVHVFTRGKLLERFPPKVRRAAAQSLQIRGIQIHEHRKVTSIRRNRIDFEAGVPFDADFIFLATGVLPSPIIAASGLTTGPDGGLAVNAYLQSLSYPNIFGGGDCIYFQRQPLEKVGVYAVRQNPILLHNLRAALEGSALKPFPPGGAYLLILNMGDGTGLLYKWRILLKGRVAFLIKDRIDRRFMRKFQSIE
jgi:NADH dehydrogenase FAD-containing subunit